MAYIGNIPALQYITHAKQTFTADSSAVAFTLSQPVANENELEVFVNNVRQEPGSGKAYTASGTTLTMSEAPTTGDSFYCIYQGKATQTVTPGASTVTNAMLAGSIDLTSKVTGTLPIANGGIGATTLAGAGITNTPMVSLSMSTNQNTTDATDTLVAFNTVDVDTDSAYTNTAGNYKFTVPSGKAGKYMITFMATSFTEGSDTIMAKSSIYKNGSVISVNRQRHDGGRHEGTVAHWVGDLSVNDYIQFYHYHDTTSSTPQLLSGTQARATIVKLIG